MCLGGLPPLRPDEGNEHARLGANLDEGGAGAFDDHEVLVLMGSDGHHEPPAVCELRLQTRRHLRRAGRDKNARIGSAWRMAPAATSS